MGIYITLEIIPHMITPEDWAEVYHESLKLLEAYPGGIMGYKEEQVDSLERICDSRTLEHCADNPKERHWYAVGDFAGMKRGESFELYYDLQYYNRKYVKTDLQPYDILIDVALVNGRDADREGKSVHVFGEKTQGEPYHIPLLAVASLIENRFAPYAIAGGDIDIGQAQKAVGWANTILERKIDLPVRVQPELLYERTEKCFKGVEAIEAYRSVFRGSPDDKFKVLFQKCERSTLNQWFIMELKRYESPNQLGAIALFTNWLNSSCDIEALCELACHNEDGPRFDPVEFASSLCATWVSIDPQFFDFLNILKQPGGALGSVEEQFGMALLDLSGCKGRGIKCYISEENLFEVFKEKFPSRIDEIKKAIQSKIKKIKSELAEGKEFFEKVLMPVGEKDHNELLELLGERAEAEDVKDAFLFFDSYENLSQVKKDMLKVFAIALKKLKSKVEKKASDMLRKSQKEKWRMIVRITQDIDMRLTEDAWAWIDKEKKSDMLNLLLVLLAIKGYEEKYWRIRTAIFENRKLALEILRLMADERVMDEASQLIKERM